MSNSAATHPDNDRVHPAAEYYIARAEDHLRPSRAGDQRQDHLFHAATRILMAVTWPRKNIRVTRGKVA